MEQISIFQRGFNFSQDGPGNRLVFHLTGCNMKCPWCSNPEGMCKTDGTWTMELDEVIELCRRSVPMFFSGGGVTFTGGEATLQFSQLKILLSRLKELNINTALETNATSARLVELSDSIDFLITDLKHPDSEMHRKFTGISNQTIKENIAKLNLSREQLLVRIALINGVNSDDKALRGYIDFFNTLRADKFQIELLEYHEYGKSKWDAQGRTYEMHDAFVTQEQLDKFERAFKNNGFSVIKT